MLKQFTHNALNTLAAASTNLSRNSWGLVVEPAFEIVATGIAIALLAITTLIVASIGHPTYTAIAQVGAGFALYMILTNFEPKRESSTAYEARFFVAGGMIFMPIIISFALAAVATGAPFQVILSAAIASAIIPGVGMLIGIWLMIRVIRAAVWFADNVIFKVADELNPDDTVTPPLAELLSFPDEEAERQQAAAATSE